ncbi:hypothetical protein [Catellatospora sp. NPDC049609]|uniref:hypothetical protein n=1 Tax=Catellatospora sp. NPDC049609 TaxID=3155505 RepID=UPI0034287EF0
MVEPTQPPQTEGEQAAGAVRSWWRRNPTLRNWISGVASAVVVTVVSGAVLTWLNLDDGPAGHGEQPASPSAASDGPPFAVDVLYRGVTCQPYLVDADPAQLVSPHTDPSRPWGDSPTDDEVIAWMHQTGAVPSHGRVLITVLGGSGKAVVLQGMTIEVVERGPARDVPAVYNVEDGCGAGEQPRLFATVLDTASPVLRPYPGADLAGNEIPAVAFPFTVSETDPEIFEITADPGACDCSWRLRLRWVAGDRSGTLVIDDHGKPFRTAAFVEATARRYLDRQSGGKCSEATWCDVPQP